MLKDYETKHYTEIHNDNEAFRACINDDTVYCGFNSKGYDQYIAKAVCAGFSPEEVKQVNDWIIAGNQGWECPLLSGVRFWFNNIDIKDDMQMGLSLKAIEGHLGMSIEETEVDFNLDRPLTPEEIKLTFKYGRHDVDAAEVILDLRKNYLQNKINIGKLAGLDEVKAMSMTNAKLTAALLKARLTEHDDEREYKYPDNLRREYIPQEVFDFFDRMKDDEKEYKKLKYVSQVEDFASDMKGRIKRLNQTRISVVFPTVSFKEKEKYLIEIVKPILIKHIKLALSNQNYYFDTKIKTKYYANNGNINFELSVDYDFAVDHLYNFLSALKTDIKNRDFSSDEDGIA